MGPQTRPTGRRRWESWNDFGALGTLKLQGGIRRCCWGRLPATVPDRMMYPPELAASGRVVCMRVVVLTVARGGGGTSGVAQWRRRQANNLGVTGSSYWADLGTPRSRLPPFALQGGGGQDWLVSCIRPFAAVGSVGLFEAVGTLRDR